MRYYKESAISVTLKKVPSIRYDTPVKSKGVKNSGEIRRETPNPNIKPGNLTVALIPDISLYMRVKKKVNQLKARKLCVRPIVRTKKKNTEISVRLSTWVSKQT